MRARTWGAIALVVGVPQQAMAALPGSIRPEPSSPWAWQRSAQLVWSSNILHAGDGPRAAALRLSYQGSQVGRLPAGWGLYRLDLEQQTLRFSQARFNYGGMAASLTLCHALFGPFWVYEGATTRLQVANALPGATFADADYFLGLAAAGLALGGQWQVGLTGDRLNGPALRDTYWGLALRGGFARKFSPLAIIGLQTSLALLDPVIAAGPLYRAFLGWTLESEAGPGARLGLRGTVGAQVGSAPSGWFLELGPFFQAAF